MKNLVGRKVKFNLLWSGVSKETEYEIIDVVDDCIKIEEDNGTNGLFHTSNLDNGNIELLVDEWMPKQGEKIFAGKDDSNCIECIYVATYKGLHYTTNGIHRYIEPFKEEIKVKDWVYRKDDLTVWKIRDAEDVDVAKNSECIKITDKELIKKLEEL